MLGRAVSFVGGGYRDRQMLPDLCRQLRAGGQTPPAWMKQNLSVSGPVVSKRKSTPQRAKQQIQVLTTSSHDNDLHHLFKQLQVTTASSSTATTSTTTTTSFPLHLADHDILKQVTKLVDGGEQSLNDVNSRICTKRNWRAHVKAAGGLRTFLAGRREFEIFEDKSFRPGNRTRIKVQFQVKTVSSSTAATAPRVPADHDILKQVAMLADGGEQSLSLVCSKICNNQNWRAHVKAAGGLRTFLAAGREFEIFEDKSFRPGHRTRIRQASENRAICAAVATMVNKGSNSLSQISGHICSNPKWRRYVKAGGRMRRFLACRYEFEIFEDNNFPSDQRFRIRMHTVAVA
jgi:hypothetical protein